jgi:dolichol-phosphate mannosyltransferase
MGLIEQSQVAWYSYPLKSHLSMTIKSVSIVLPTYNESANIVNLIEAIILNIPANWKFEVIVVDDCSPDNTLEKVKRAFSNNKKIITILRKKDRGFARSIRAGIERANYEYIIVMDSDSTHDPKEIKKLLHIGTIYDFISASRFCAGGNMLDKKHYLLSFIYNLILRVIIRTQLQDNLGGYFLTRRKILANLPMDEIFFGYGDYYFRLLHFIQKAKYSIIEIPANYLSRQGGKSKSNWLRMFCVYTYRAIRLKLNIDKIEN